MDKLVADKAASLAKKSSEGTDIAAKSPDGSTPSMAAPAVPPPPAPEGNPVDMDKIMMFKEKQKKSLEIRLGVNFQRPEFERAIGIRVHASFAECTSRFRTINKVLHPDKKIGRAHV